MPLPPLTPLDLQPLPGVTVEEPATGSVRSVFLDSIKRAVVEPIADIKASLPPVLSAGVQLAKFVLWLAVLSIVALLAYLYRMDSTIGTDLEAAYKPAISQSQFGLQLEVVGRIDRLWSDLSAAKTAQTPSWSPESLQNAKSTMALLERLSALTESQRETLNACIPLPPDAEREPKLQACVDTMATLRRAAFQATGSTAAQTAGELADRVNAQRKSLHDFWLQAAQLILLNLLLPLLTALLGYVFGTQQVSTKAE